MIFLTENFKMLQFTYLLLYKYWLHESVTWEICHLEETIVDRGETEVDIGFWWVTIFHVTLSCSQYWLYNTDF